MTKHRYLGWHYILLLFIAASAAFAVFHDGLVIGGYWWIDVALVVMLALGFGYHILHRAWEHGHQHAQEQVSGQHAPVAEYAVDPTPSGKTRRLASPLRPR